MKLETEQYLAQMKFVQMIQLRRVSKTYYFIRDLNYSIHFR